jgi:hypothetical protein
MVLLSEKNATVNVVEELEPDELGSNNLNKKTNSSFDSGEKASLSASATTHNGTAGDSVSLSFYSLFIPLTVVQISRPVCRSKY